jgi:hypothetical protein
MISRIVLGATEAANFGVTFEHHGIRAHVELVQ